MYEEGAISFIETIYCLYKTDLVLEKERMRVSIENTSEFLQVKTH